MPSEHPGFKAIQQKIAKKYGMKRAGAILAAKTRAASPAAKRANPNLKKVKGQFMPLSKYFKGHGEEVMANMQKEYGPEKGKQVFYATANKKKAAEKISSARKKK